MIARMLTVSVLLLLGAAHVALADPAPANGKFTLRQDKAHDLASELAGTWEIDKDATQKTNAKAASLTLGLIFKPDAKAAETMGPAWESHLENLKQRNDPAAPDIEKAMSAVYACFSLQTEAGDFSDLFQIAVVAHKDGMAMLMTKGKRCDVLPVSGFERDAAGDNDKLTATFTRHGDAVYRRKATPSAVSGSLKVVSDSKCALAAELPGAWEFDEAASSATAPEGAAKFTAIEFKALPQAEARLAKTLNARVAALAKNKPDEAAALARAIERVYLVGVMGPPGSAEGRDFALVEYHGNLAVLFASSDGGLITLNLSLIRDVKGDADALVLGFEASPNEIFKRKK